MSNQFFPVIKNMPLSEAVNILQKYDNTEFSQDVYKGCGCPITTDFTGIRIKNGDYIDCTFNGNNFQYTGAAGSHFCKCKLISCNINGSNMQFCDFSNSVFCDNTEETYLIQGSNFNQSCFYGTTFQNVCVDNASICQSQFLGTKIKDSHFQNVTLQDNIFRDTEIIQSSFIGCNLEYSDFINVKILDSILPFHQIPYIYGGLQCISEPNNTVKVSSSMENAEILSSEDYKELLPAFIKYYENECEYFPLANIALFFGEFSAAKMFFAETNCRLLQNAMYVGCCIKALGATPPNPCKINGWGKSKPTFTPSVDSAITYKKGLQLSAFYFCNKHGNFDRNELLDFYFNILQYFNSIELSPNEHYQFGIHIDEIKRILFDVSYLEKPHVEIILKTNLTIEEGKELTKVISIIEDCLGYYNINDEEYNLELKHNSPSYSLWLVICSLDPNLLVMTLGMISSVFSGDMSNICQAISACADIVTVAAFIRDLTDKTNQQNHIKNTADLPIDNDTAYALSRHKLLKKKTKIEFSLGNVHFNYSKTKTYQ